MGEFFEDVLVNTARQVTLTAVGAVWFMLGVRVVHENWLKQVPTVSYFTSLVILMLFASAFSLATTDD